MTEPRPVTDDDVNVAWHDFYADDSQPRFRDPDVNAPGANGWGDQIILAGLRRVLEADRKRQAEREVSP